MDIFMAWWCSVLMLDMWSRGHGFGLLSSGCYSRLMSQQRLCVSLITRLWKNYVEARNFSTAPCAVFYVHHSDIVRCQWTWWRTWRGSWAVCQSIAWSEAAPCWILRVSASRSAKDFALRLRTVTDTLSENTATPAVWMISHFTHSYQ